MGWWQVRISLPNGERHVLDLEADGRADAIDKARNTVERGRGKRLPRRATIATQESLWNRCGPDDDDDDGDDIVDALPVDDSELA